MFQNMSNKWFAGIDDELQFVKHVAVRIEVVALSVSFHVQQFPFIVPTIYYRIVNFISLKLLSFELKATRLVDPCYVNGIKTVHKTLPGLWEVRRGGGSFYLVYSGDTLTENIINCKKYKTPAFVSNNVLSSINEVAGSQCLQSFVSVCLSILGPM